MDERHELIMDPTFNFAALTDPTRSLGESGRGMIDGGLLEPHWADVNGLAEQGLKIERVIQRAGLREGSPATHARGLCSEEED